MKANFSYSLLKAWFKTNEIEAEVNGNFYLFSQLYSFKFNNVRITFSMIVAAGSELIFMKIYCSMHCDIS